MKHLKLVKTGFIVAGIVVALTALANLTQAEEKKAPPAKPYPLTTCIVTDEKLDADPAMKSFAFVHEGQEIKLCCQSCQKDFNKSPAKYLKKLEKPATDKAKK